MKKWIVAVALALLGCPAWADSVPPLTLEQAIQTALANNPQVQAETSRLAISEAELKTAGTRLNPSLMSDNGVAEKTYRLGIEQTIELGGKRKRRVALAKAQRDTVQADIDTRLLDIRTAVRRAYTQLYNAQEREKTYENILKVTQELVGITRTREKAGDVSRLDVLQADIMRVNANNDLQIAIMETLTARNSLNSLLNQPLTTPLVLTAPNALPQLGSPSLQTTPSIQSGTMLQGSVNQMDADLESLLADALRHRPEIRQNQSQIEVTRRQTTLARANRIPNLSIAVGPDYVAEPGQSEINAFLIGNLELPLFNRQQGPQEEAQARRTQLEQELSALQQRIRLEVTNAYTRFKGNEERIQRYETQLLPYSVAVVDKSRRAFEEGKSAILMPLNAQQAYMNTRLGYLQALMDLQTSISDLERAVGAGL